MKNIIILLSFCYSALVGQVNCSDTTNFYRLTKGKQFIANCDTVFIITSERHKKLVASLDQNRKTILSYNNVLSLMKDQNKDLESINQKHKKYIDSLEIHTQLYLKKNEELASLVNRSTELTTNAVNKAKAYRRWNIVFGSAAAILSGLSLGLIMFN